LWTLIITVIVQIALFVQVAILILEKFSIPFKSAFLVAGSAMNGMQFMPVSIANMGVREFNIHHFLELFVNGDIGEGVLSVSLVILLSNLILPAFIGFVSFLFERIKGK
jgi:hypothetical protein